MIKLTTLLISCSLALAGAAVAQQPDTEGSPAKEEAPGKGKGAVGKKPSASREHPAPNPGGGAGEAKPGGPAGGGTRPPRNAIPPEGAAAKQESPAVMKPPGTEAKPHGKAAKEDAAAKSAIAPNAAEPAATTGSTMTDATATAAPRDGMRKNNKGAPVGAAYGQRGAKGNPKATPSAAAAAASATAAPAATASASVAPVKAPSAAPPVAPSATPAITASATAATTATAAPSAAPTVQPNPLAAKKPDPQQIQQIKTEHANFRAQARPDKVPPVTFRQDYRIQGSDRWQGQQYEVYRSYRPERHDRDWYHARYQRVELVGGGYYYWNNGYWYPAWGYSPREEYYAYDAPIYVGKRAEPPDRVIADVQTTLQQMGYYKGEVDGLLGPLTREALTGYQNDQGLMATAVIDEPTLASLGMG